MYRKRNTKRNGKNTLTHAYKSLTLCEISWNESKFSILTMHGNETMRRIEKKKDFFLSKRRADDTLFSRIKNRWQQYFYWKSFERFFKYALLIIFNVISSKCFPNVQIVRNQRSTWIQGKKYENIAAIESVDSQSYRIYLNRVYRI